jgi:aspartyl-tRNA(Asn)/glutamyl-tRNA(Gln) amidotransferase subunit B
MEARIGLEVHVQMTTLKTKLFCGCSSDYRNKPPNTNVCPVCLGLPGALPVVNEEAIKKGLRVAIALNMHITDKIEWVRNHYFYPDLPKNYQITQYEGRGMKSFAKNGELWYRYNNEYKRARIRRINIEEDPGKIVYPTGSMLTSKYALIDYNRSGIALLEIVTEPDFSEPEEVVSFLKELRILLEYLEISNFDLEGAMRADVNISVGGGTRVEVKNIGSLSDIAQAIRYEVARQKSLIEKGMSTKMETRHWDPIRKVTVAVRRKESVEDYRYMPDPNLPPYIITKQLLEQTRKSLPELPREKLERYMREYGLTQYMSTILTNSRRLSEYFEKVIGKTGVEPYKAASYIVNDLLGWIPGEDPNILWEKVPPERTAEVLEMLRKKQITIKMAKEMVPYLVEGLEPAKVIEKKGWVKKVSREEIANIVREVLREKPSIIEDIKRNKRAIQHVIGEVLRRTGGRAEPKTVYEVVWEIIKKEL